MIHAVVFSVGKKPLCINKLFILELNQICIQKKSISILYRRSRVVSTTFCPLLSFSVNSGSCCNYWTLHCCVIRKFAFRSFNFMFLLFVNVVQTKLLQVFFVFNITFQQGAVNVFHPIYIAWMSMIVTHRRGNLYWPFRTKHVSTRSWNYSKT